MLFSVGVGGFPCLVVIVDLLGSAHIMVAVIVVEKLCVFFLGSLSGVWRARRNIPLGSVEAAAM